MKNKPNLGKAGQEDWEKEFEEIFDKLPLYQKNIINIYLYENNKRSFDKGYEKGYNDQAKQTRRIQKTYLEKIKFIGQQKREWHLRGYKEGFKEGQKSEREKNN